MEYDEDLGPSSSRWWEFEQFVRHILQAMPGVEIRDAGGDVEIMRKDLGFDIEAVRNGRPLLVQIKTQTPQTSARVSDLAKQLRAAADRYEHEARRGGRTGRPELVAAVSGVLAQHKLMTAQREDIQVWDGRYLRRQAQQLGIHVPYFVAVPEEEESPEAKLPTHELIRRLEAIAPGRNDAAAYEKWCEDVLNFLFCPPLNPPITQSSNDSRSNRRDLILPNYATRGFWHYMGNRYHADAVVAEAKNLVSPVDKSAVLQLANYLSQHGTGLFGMLLTRRGLNASAEWTRREHWVLHNKMIIGLDDGNMRQMLDSKLAGNDPFEMIRQKIEDFRLHI
jgi:hypothetical protein